MCKALGSIPSAKKEKEKKSLLRTVGWKYSNPNMKLQACVSYGFEFKLLVYKKNGNSQIKRMI
jgi:hypothetical protein